MLSPAQQLAVTATGHVLIAACPGSGKTTVLKFRAEHLLRSDEKARLAAVTFTKDAAASLKDKITQQYPAGAKRTYAGTFHKLCIQQLKASGNKFTTIEEGAKFRIIRAAIKACPHADPGLEYGDCVTQIEQWQRELVPHIPPAETSALAFVYREYTRKKQEFGVVDFGDMLRNSVMGMRAGTVKPLDVAFMLVDEFQDTDGMQLLWVLEHAKQGTDVTIVGDDDQSIFGFRGSLGYNGMLQFQEKTGATVINLDRTYRCSLEVLKPAALLIENNTARVPKTLITANSAPGTVRVRTFETREAEAEAIVAAVLESGDASMWGILARTNGQLDLLESRINKQFDYTKKEGKSFWELPAPSLLLAVTQSVSGRTMEGISSLLEFSGVSSATLNNLSKQFQFGAPGALDRFCEMKLPKSADRSGFIEHMQSTASEWRDQLRSGSQSQLKLALAGIGNHIHRYGKWKPSESADTKKRLDAATSSLASLKGTIDQRLRTLSQKDSPKKEAGASLMTLHGSKGLEFDRVWVMGCDEGTLPSTRDGSDEQEERRLMYVAITRATTNLVISYTLEGNPSKFLYESRLLGGTGYEGTGENSAAFG